jgi:hypothetical protein
LPTGKRDVIITGGENVSSIEVEDAIFSHPQIDEVAVIGVPDEKWGELVMALVVLAPGATLTEADVIAYTRAKLAAYQCPKRVEFRSSLARPATGNLAEIQVAGAFTGRAREEDQLTTVLRIAHRSILPHAHHKIIGIAQTRGGQSLCAARTASVTRLPATALIWPPPGVVPNCEQEFFRRSPGHGNQREVHPPTFCKSSLFWKSFVKNQPRSPCGVAPCHGRRASIRANAAASGDAKDQA